MTKGDKHLNILLFTSNGSGFSAVLSLKFLEYGKDQSIAWLGNCLTWCNSQPIVVAAPQDKPPNMHHRVYVGMRVCVCVCEKSGNMINVPIENLEETTYTHRLVIWLRIPSPNTMEFLNPLHPEACWLARGHGGTRYITWSGENYFPIHLKVRPCLGTLTLWPTTVKALYQLYMVLNGLIIP